jgi:hypothetical protein
MEGKAKGMKPDRDKDIQKSRHESSRRDFYKTAESFSHWLAERLNVGARATVMLARRSARSHRFAKEIIYRRRDIRGADILGFLAFHFGHKFASMQTHRLAGERVYRQPLRSVRNTIYKNVTDLFVSVNVSQLVQNLQLFLNHVRTMLNVASAQHSNVESERTQTFIERRELSRAMEFRQTIWSPGEALSRSASRRETTHNSFETRTLDLRETRMRDRFETRLRDRFETRMAAQLDTRFLDRFETRLPGPTFILTRRHTSDRERTLIQERNNSTTKSPVSNLFSRALVNVKQVRNSAGNSTAPVFGFGAHAAPALLRTPGGRRPSTPARGARDSVTSKNMSQHRSSTELSFLFTERFAFARAKGVNPISDSLANPGAITPLSAFGTLTKKFTLLSRTSQLSTHEAQRLKTTSAAAEESRKTQLASEFILVRKEGAARAPSIDFVFAKPSHQKTTQETVMKTLEQREIVELVRKEVRQSTTRVSPLKDFTRDDYAEISDRVYSALMKRLTVERERPGLR